MSSRKNTQQTYDFVKAGIVILLIFVAIIIGTQYLRNLIASNIPDAPGTPIVKVTEGDIKAKFTIVSLECIDEKVVNYAVVNLVIDGGLLPYDLTFINSKSEIKGPYSIKQDDIPVQIKVYGGDTFTAYIIATNNMAWKGSITIPAEDPFCQLIMAPSATPSFTLTASATHTNTPTASSTHTDTPTSTIIISASTPINKNTSEPGTTRPTDVIISNTPSTTFPSTATPKPPTNTPIPPTHTPDPQINTPIPPTHTPNPPINTPIPPTHTPNPPTPKPPTPTTTPFNPNPKACEDGVDNDGDNLIDYPNDPECTKPGDQHEDK